MMITILADLLKPAEGNLRVAMLLQLTKRSNKM